jgi:hypothetical protein
MSPLSGSHRSSRESASFGADARINDRLLIGNPDNQRANMSESEIELPVDSESPGRAREALAGFRDRMEESSFIDAQWMLSELISDVVISGEEEHPVRVRIEIRGDCLHVEVTEDALVYRLRSRRPEPGEPGWGLYLTRVLAQWWGTRHEGERGCVWFQASLAR